jgi:hypothetical protein
MEVRRPPAPRCVALPRSLSVTEVINRRHCRMSRQIPLIYPTRPSFPCFDVYVDMTCTRDDPKGGSSVGFFSALSYSRPENMAGRPTLDHLQVSHSRRSTWPHLFLARCCGQRWITSLDVSGTNFLVFYEMMTGTLDLKIRVLDNSYNLASLLLHLLNPGETQRASYALSVLRVLANNPELAQQAPKLEGRSKSKLDLMKNAQIMKTFGKQARYLIVVMEVLVVKVSSCRVGLWVLHSPASEYSLASSFG